MVDKKPRIGGLPSRRRKKPEPETPFTGLDFQERVFVEAFIDCGNATAAALEAKYSLDVARCAYLLLEKPNIRKAIQLMRLTVKESVKQSDFNRAVVAREAMAVMAASEQTRDDLRVRILENMVGNAKIKPIADLSEEQSRGDRVLDKIDNEKKDRAVLEFVRSKETVIEERDGAIDV